MAENFKEELIELRRDFHSHPELDFELFETSKRIRNFLDKEGIEYKITAKTGICGIIRGGKEGKLLE